MWARTFSAYSLRNRVRDTTSRALALLRAERTGSRNLKDRSAVPTLIADGSVDRLDPVVNDHRLASAITKAQLVLYPDAGHAFLFQEESTFVPAVEAFLYGTDPVGSSNAAWVTLIQSWSGRSLPSASRHDWILVNLADALRSLVVT